MIDLSNLFDGRDLLESVDLDFNDLDPKGIKIHSMFQYCYHLKEVKIKNFIPENLKDMSCMFLNCANLKALPDISNWDTQYFTDLNDIFNNCSSLITFPDISKWNTGKVIYMDFMFYNCLSLGELPDISNWNVSNVVSFADMFGNCQLLTKFRDFKMEHHKSKGFRKYALLL